MKAYFDILLSSLKKQVFIALSSKEQNVKAGSHCNFMIFQLEPDLTGQSKQAPVVKMFKIASKRAQLFI